jgi:putative phosphoesterase
MKVAVLSDIHGNDVALSAVLSQIRREEVSRIFVLGDVVGYYYRPERVLSLLQDWDCVMIQGNHERLMIESRDDAERARKLKEQYGSGLMRALRQLSQDEVEFLAALPKTVAENVDGVRCLLAHGTPFDPDEYLYPNSDPKALDRCGNVDVDFVFLGHTHRPFIHAGPRAVVVNVGSVGQARTRGGFAEWALMNPSDRTVAQKLTPYDTTSLLADVAQNDPDVPYLASVLRRQ